MTPVARRRTPARGAPPGADHPRAIFTWQDVDEIRALALAGSSQREIAELLTALIGRWVWHSTIGKVIRGDTYHRKAG